MPAIGKEDIYESEGNIEKNDRKEDEKEIPSHPDIELVSVDIDAALEKYKGRVINLKSVDFSDSIAAKRRNLIGRNQYILEVAGNGYSGNETANEKLNRILYEIADLNEQIKSDQSLKSDLLNEEVLNNISGEIKNLQEAKSSTAVSNSEVEMPVPKSNPQASSLELRLRRIEQVLGNSNIPCAPILDTIEDLKLRCETLNASYVSGLEQRLNVIVTKLGKIEESREKNEVDENTESKIDEILGMMQKWDIACSSLPSNVNKVKALNRLHEQAQHFGSRLSHLKTVREKLEKEVEQGKAAILEFETTGKQEMATVVEKLKLLEATVAGLK